MGDVVVNEDLLEKRRDEIFSEFLKAWEYATFQLEMDGPFPIVWRMQEIDNLPTGNDNRNPWARVTFRHGSAAATSISQRRYENKGTFTVECFVGQNTTDAGAKAEKLCRSIVEWYRAYTGNVQLKNIRVVNATPQAGYAKCNMLTDFTYTEFAQRDNNVNKVVIDDLILNDAMQRLTDDNSEAYRL